MMENENKVAISVIIPHYNKRDYLAHCLTSLYASQVDFPYEVIVVDNASKDDSLAMVESQFKQAILLKLDNNHRFSKACNEGIKISRGKYIALLNNDTEVDPKWLLNLKRALDEHKEVGSCASKVYFFNNRSKIDSAGDDYTIAGTAQKIGHGEIMAGAFSEQRHVFGASASSSIYRREIFSEVGLLDEELFFGHEDVDLSFRAQLLGYKCLYVPSAVIYHHVSATIGYMSDRYVYLSQRNLEFVYLKNMPITLLFKYLPLHFLYMAGAAFFSLKKGRFFSFIRGKVSVMLHLSSILRKRRMIQKNRKASDEYIDSLLQRSWFRTKFKKCLT